ncbi:MAG: hypothetical protein M1814_001093, partial [Vezdaea aestivalis]
MTELTSLFYELLKNYGASKALNPPRHSQVTDGFTKEAYRINLHISELRIYLLSIRQPYLSTAHPGRRTGAYNPSSEKERRWLSDAQREEIDAESKGTLRNLNAAIVDLAKAEEIRQEMEMTLSSKRRARAGLGTIGRWAAGGSAREKTPAEQNEEARLNALKEHREGIIWYVRRKLELCSEVQRSMMERRIQREIEKNKSISYKYRGPTSMGQIQVSSPTVSTATNTLSRGGETQDGRIIKQGYQQDLDTQHNLSPEQLQLFAEENDSMVKHYEETLGQVRTAERSLIEISEQQTTLASHLEIQNAHIDQLVVDSVQTTENVGGGNKELKRAAERPSTA